MSRLLWISSGCGSCPAYVESALVALCVPSKWFGRDNEAVGDERVGGYETLRTLQSLENGHRTVLDRILEGTDADDVTRRRERFEVLLMTGVHRCKIGSTLGDNGVFDDVLHASNTIEGVLPHQTM